MRNRWLKCSLGAAVLAATSMFAAASGCGHLDDGTADGAGPAEDQLEADSTMVQGSTARPTPEAAVPGLVPGARLDARALAVFDKAALTGVGSACTGLGSQCAPPVNGIVRECGGFTSTCDSTGTEDVIPISFLCLPGTTGLTCQAIAGQQQQTISCTVPTNGKACSSGCGGSSCAPYHDDCDETTDRVQGCLSGGTCQNDACTNETFTQIVVGTCTRDTENNRCQPRTACQPGRVGLCNANGVCNCLLGIP
jgi:hypothetical protein